MRHLALCLLCAAACSTTESSTRDDQGFADLSIASVDPGIVLPGSTIVVGGRSFLGEPLGKPSVIFRGTFSTGGEDREVTVHAPARFVDFDELEVDVSSTFLDQLGAFDGEFSGTAKVSIESTIDGEIYETPALGIELAVRSSLTPSVETLTADGLHFANDWIEFEGGGFLLGGGEGTTVARIEGCLRLVEQQDCETIDPVEVTIEPMSRFDRSRGRFALIPEAVGIRSGEFTGSISLINRHGDGYAVESETTDVQYDLTEAVLFDIDPPSASVGQYVTVFGAGFLGGGTGRTLLRFQGEYRPERGEPETLDLLLVPEFVEGRVVRYLLSEDDPLGEIIDMRYGSGSLTGTLTPEIRFLGDQVTGDPLPVALELAPVRQVVYLNFQPQFVIGLQAYGLRAVEAEIIARIEEVVKRDYAGINVDVRVEEPSDFALYAEVQLAGHDPNGYGLLGYDNTPGKDVGNERLHDQIGGVNAQTQQDGYPGFGGVFIESLFVFSEHPGEFATESRIADSRFDDIFDPFRPDRGGKPVRAADLSAGIPVLASTVDCPAKDRPTQLACAIQVLGNLIGSTLSHEIGHSLGLANPQGGDVHYLSDGPRRIMDAGTFRPFSERAELGGDGPAVFCRDAYLYLRSILPTDAEEQLDDRPNCF